MTQRQRLTRGVSGAVLAAGVWSVLAAPDTWEQWQALQHHADERAQLQQAVQAQRQAASAVLADAGGAAGVAGPSSDGLDATRWAEHARALGLQVRFRQASTEAGVAAGAARPPGHSSRPGEPWTEWEFQGRFSDWCLWWDHALAHAPPGAVRRVQVKALPSGQAHVTVHLAGSSVAHAVPQREAAVDAFDAPAWRQVLRHAAEQAPGFDAVRPHWKALASPLAQHALADLHYLGHLRDLHSAWALVRVARPADVPPLRAVLHTLRVGDPLGPDLGQVVAITDEHLQVRQWRLGSDGHWHSEVVAMALHSPSADKGARP